jgi:hypothetical protein
MEVLGAAAQKARPEEHKKYSSKRERRLQNSSSQCFQEI